jgi:hypothetical protein
MWSCYHNPDGTERRNLTPEEIRAVLASGTGTLWVDLCRDEPADTELLKSVFEFHPLATSILNRE